MLDAAAVIQQHYHDLLQYSEQWGESDIVVIVCVTFDVVERKQVHNAPVVFVFIRERAPSCWYGIQSRIAMCYPGQGGKHDSFQCNGLSHDADDSYC